MIGENAARKLLGGRDFEKGRLIFARGGGWMVALSRAVPILPEAISCTAGLVRMPFGRFLAALACGSLPVGFLYAWIGSVGREAPVWALAFSLGAPALLWLAALGLGPLREPTLGVTIYWVINQSAFLRGLWWWGAVPISIVALIFVMLFLISIGLDEVANPRVRRAE